MGYGANQLGYVAKQVYKLQINSDVKIINLTVFYFFCLNLNIDCISRCQGTVNITCFLNSFRFFKKAYNTNIIQPAYREKTRTWIPKQGHHPPRRKQTFLKFVFQWPINSQPSDQHYLVFYTILNVTTYFNLLIHSREIRVYDKIVSSNGMIFFLPHLMPP